MASFSATTRPPRCSTPWAARCGCSASLSSGEPFSAPACGSSIPGTVPHQSTSKYTKGSRGDPRNHGEIMANENVQTFTDGNFDDSVLKSNGPVLVDFWAEWCGPCKRLGPTVDALAV